MKELSDLTVCVVDNSLFLPIAQRLAQVCKRVLYTTSRKRGFSVVNDCIIGDGFDNITRINEIWDWKHLVDLFVFPDIEYGKMQMELERQGYPVWGSRHGDKLELLRGHFLEVLRELNLEVPNVTVCDGLNALRKHLKHMEDKYVKISRYRGTLETFHWRKWYMDEGLLDDLAVQLGPLRDELRFLVFDAIPAELEYGADTYCIDGKFPQRWLYGIEHKDQGYIGSVQRREVMPQPAQTVNELFGPILKEYGYRNFWSTEIRQQDEKFWFIDPCCRCPMPGTGSQIALIKNLPEIIWAGANGELVEPEWNDKFSAECVLTTKAENSQWTVVDFPKSLRPHLCCGSCCKVNGCYCWPPNEMRDHEIGWLVATGDSMADAIETLKGYAEELPDGVEAHLNSLIELLKEAQTAEDEGVPLSTQPVPKPEMVVQ